MTYTSARLLVLVDDLPNPDDDNLYPAHGLSILVELRGDERVTILFDTGPSAEILKKNASRLGLSVLSPDIVFLSVWLGHHVGGFVQTLRYNEGVWYKTVAPEFPALKAQPPAKGKLPSYTKLVGPFGLWFREQALAFQLDEGWVIIAGCSLYGIRHLINATKNLRPVYAVIGGFNLSSLDVLDGPYFMRWARRVGARIVVPLHSVAPKARRIILKKLGNGIVWSGVGLDVEL